MRTLASIGLLALLPLLAAPYMDQSRENIGTVSGALVGGAAGAVLTGIYPGVIGGAVLGAYFGNRVGRDFDPQPSPAHH